MALSIAVSAVQATAVTLSVSGAPTGTEQLDIQYSDRPDFQFTLAPVARFGMAAAVQLEGLNQQGRYYIRARPVSGSDIPGPWGEVIGVMTPMIALRTTAPAPVMIEPAVIVAPEPVLSWYSPSEQPGYPARALGRDDPMSQLWAHMTDFRFAIEMVTAGGPVDVLALLETNIPEGGLVTIKADNTEAGVRGFAPAFTYGPVPFRASAGLPQRRGYHGFWRLPAPQSFRRWRIEVTGLLPGDMMVATYAVVGLARQTKNYAVGSKSETLLDTGSLERDRGGSPNRVSGHRGRKVEFEIQQMREADYETQFERIRWLVGITEPTLVIPNSKPGSFLHDRLLYGELAAGRAVNESSPRFSQGFAVTSLI